MKKHLILITMVVICIVSTTGCLRNTSPDIVNEMNFDLSNISELTIAYDDEQITFFESDNEKLIVKEHMNRARRSYFANVTEKENTLHISEGAKPISKDAFSRYIEVYLPMSYQKDLTVTATSGNIDLSKVKLQLNSLRVDCTSGGVTLAEVLAKNVSISSTSGSLEIGRINADQIRFSTTSANISCKELIGAVNCVSSSGNIEIQSAAGSGVYKANNSGALNVTYIKITGDVSLFNKNDAIALTLPSELDFHFIATTKNGSVTTNFQSSITVNGRITSGAVGTNPNVTISAETTNGDIRVTKSGI